MSIPGMIRSNFKENLAFFKGMLIGYIAGTLAIGMMALSRAVNGA